MRHVEELKQRRYAVIVDEAHSSQTGDAAKEMKKVLGGGRHRRPAGAELRAAEAAEAGAGRRGARPGARTRSPPRSPPAAGSRTCRSSRSPPPRRAGRWSCSAARTRPPASSSRSTCTRCARRSRRGSSSTCWPTTSPTTPTSRSTRPSPTTPSSTRPGPARRSPGSCRCTSTTWPRRPRSSSSTSAATSPRKIGGQAKAMVVTASRLHALRYKQALDKYCTEHGIGDVGALVAFSGTLHDDGEELTESKVNGFPESQTPGRVRHRRLADPRRRREVPDRLRPAEALRDVRRQDAHRARRRADPVAAQPHPPDGKTGTFVLDFRNTVEDIQDAFEPWYAHTVAPPTDPHLLYDTHAELGPFDVLAYEEIESVVALLLTDPDKNHERINAGLQPAVDRFDALDEDRQDEFRDVITRFVRIYSFLSQVVSFTDVKLERDYLFCRALARLIKREPGIGCRPRRRRRADPSGHGEDVRGRRVARRRRRRGRHDLRRHRAPAATPTRCRCRRSSPRSTNGSAPTSPRPTGSSPTRSPTTSSPTRKIQVEAAANDETSFGVGFDKTWIERPHRAARRQRGLRLPAARQPRAPSGAAGGVPARHLPPGPGRPPTDLPHRRADRPRPRGPLPRVQVDHALGRAARARRPSTSKTPS